MELQSVDPAWAWQTWTPEKKSAWNARMAAHLFRRAAFGAAPGDIERALQSEPKDVVRSLVQADEPDAFQKEVASLTRATLATNNAKNVSTAWLHRIRHTTSPLREKMVLFWHGHFATSAEKVDDAKLMQAQNSTFREHALGSFAKLTHAIAKDPAMLIYLDSAVNRKAHPNENFARELMELFCLGEGNYSEEDIRELARCFTGWEVRRNRYRFNRYQFDTGEKSIFGQTGKFKGEDGVDIVLAQNTLEMFVCRKLVHFFLFDEPHVPDDLIRPLAHQFRENDLQIAPVVETILSSNLCFSEHALAAKVRSPVELIVGFLRALDGTANLYQLTNLLDDLGQAPFYPPNVKGWDGGRTWINTSTLLARANAVRSILAQEDSRFGGESLTAFLDGQKLRSAERVFDYFTQTMFAVDVAPEIRQEILRVSKDAANPLAALIATLATLPEFQLA